MNTTPASAAGPRIRPDEMEPEITRTILDRLGSLDEDAKTAVDASEALTGIRRNLKRAPAR